MSKFQEHKWISQIFQSNAAMRGGIVRRAVRSVHKYASFDELKKSVKRRGFHVVIYGKDYLIFCSDSAKIELVNL